MYILKITYYFLAKALSYYINHISHV